jgi:hypothetical protein
MYGMYLSNIVETEQQEAVTFDQNCHLASALPQGSGSRA